MAPLVCEGYILKALQVLQNRAARAVTHKSWFTPTRRLLADCSWMSVRQLVFFHAVVSTHKIVSSGTPHYLYKMMSTSHPRYTRKAAGGEIRLGENFGSKQGLVRDSFRYRAAINYNSIPASIRTAKTLPTFKTKLKQWVTTNIPID